MKTNSFIIRLFNIVILSCFLGISQAASPVWTLTPLTATTLAVPSNDTAIVQYQVKNQSTTPRTLTMQPIHGVTQLTTGLGVCGRSFALTGKASCTLSLRIDGSLLTRPIDDGPVVCANSSNFLCYRPARPNNLNVTPVDASVILTSVSPDLGAASGGTGVTLTGVGFTGATGVTFGGDAATSVHVVDSTTVTAVTPAHAIGAVDVVISTPAGDSSLTNGYTYFEIGQMTGGGIVACLNGELNNLIASTTDNSNSIVWAGLGVSQGASSTTNGASNTEKAVESIGTNEGVPYATQLCDDLQIDSEGNTPCEPGNTCYNDWFLPAGGNTTESGQLNCLYVNRAAIGEFLNELYWSSTTVNGNHTAFVWTQDFGNGDLFGRTKDTTQRVRCVRSLP
ncbi:MAG: IPT/TIG domain-containing protein [Legionellaceae bacterium]|nr:IPT/TIG domain-containing protein [Legionellaceae bacterium]